MISTFNGFSRIIHENITVLYFTRRDYGFKIIYTLPGRTEQFSQYFDSKDPYDSLSYIKINGKKYDSDNIEKNFDRIQTLLTQETNLQAIEALP